MRSIDISLFGKGHYLDTALLTDMVTIRQARSLIEPELAYEAAANATPELIADLNLLNQQLKAAVGNQELFARLDAQFHMTLAEFIDNPIISNAVSYTHLDVYKRQRLYLFLSQQSSPAGPRVSRNRFTAFDIYFCFAAHSSTCFCISSMIF